MSNVAGKAYGMNVITPMKPWKTSLNTLIFRFGRLNPETLSGLLGLSLIHFARWVMIRRDQWPDLGQGSQRHLRNDYMLFCSNFNGTWDQYIDAFSDGIPNGLDLFWYSSTGYPHSVPITPFKDYIRHNQLDTSYYYNATPGSAQRDIKSALRVLPELRRLAALHARQSPAAFAASWRRSITVLQNDLGTPGDAPVASNDTREADWNRKAAVEALIRERASRAPDALPPLAPAPAPRPRPAKTTSFDGGHYFLTLLIPVQNQTLVKHYGIECSAVQRLRDVLATLPTALQSKATRAIGLNSPFARNCRTHLARLVVINDVQYNGREGEDAVLGAIKQTSLVTPQAQDRLSCPFLLFAADFDAADGSEATVRGYLTELWRTMEPELRAVLENCYGYTRIRDAESFCDYALACEVETTMPFNDYWANAPELPNRIPGLLKRAALIAAAALVASLVLVHASSIVTGALAYAVGAATGWLFHRARAGTQPPPSGLRSAVPAMIVGALLAAVIAAGRDPASLVVSAAVALFAVLAGRSIVRTGREPFPTTLDSDLRSVLKALYLQQQLVPFAIDHQGVDDAALHAGFARFIAEHAPDNVDAPTQPPGVVRSRGFDGDRP